MKRLTALIALVLSATVALTPADARVVVPGALPAAPAAGVPVAAQSDQVVMRIVLKRRSQRGARMNISFQLDIVGAPPDKTYQLFLLDAGMQQRGEPPVPILDPDTRFRVDAGGALTPDLFRFDLTGFVRGEWVQFTLRSTDGAVVKTVRYTPFE